MKKIFALLTVLIILAACNKDIPTASKDYIFTASKFIDSDAFDSVQQTAFNGEAFIFTAMKMFYEDNNISGYKTYLISADKHGNIITTRELTEGTEENNYESENYPAFCTVGDNFYAIKLRSRFVTTTDGFVLPENDTFLVGLDENLNETELLNIGEVFEGVITDSYSYVQSLAADTDGNVYLYMGQSIYGVNINTGEIIFTKSQSENYIGGLFGMEDGRVGIMEMKNSETGTKMVITPIEDTSTGGSISFPITGGIARGEEGSPYKYYTLSNSFIYGFNDNYDEKVMIADILASGMGNINIGTNVASQNNLFYLSPTEFAVIASDGKTQNYNFHLLTKVNPENVPDKKLITVAGISHDDNIAGFIKEYNESSSLYQVEYKFYTTGLSFNVDEQVINLNTDLVSGKAPDVLIMDNNLGYGSYVTKDLFADLYGFIDKDKDLSREDLVPSMLKVLETDGKLYKLCQEFMISSLVGKTEIFGSVPGISLTAMQEKAEKIEGAKLLNSDKMGVLYTFLYNSIGNYVDYDSQTSNFSSPEFIALLELANSYPETLESESYYNGMQTVPYAQDKTLLDTARIRDFRDALNTAKAQFDAPVTFLGFPSKNGKSGILADPRSEFAIIEGTKNPEGAWDFVKAYIYYDSPYQTGNMIHGNFFSILNSRNDELAAEALEDPYYIDPNGVKHPTENIVFAAGVQVTMPNNTDEDNKVTYDLLSNISGIARSDINIWNIVNDDMENFFAGEKSASDTAALIDNRVSTYLAESA
ncbi:MAG: hypothetical protein LBL98_08640 [Ruminococcus sp.]|jgi:ABC-type glycerol-3-phosphate transport system substrate-binding protein|nr:hypothetical protein [Ruminococcus sp.]